MHENDQDARGSDRGRSAELPGSHDSSEHGDTARMERPRRTFESVADKVKHILRGS